MALHSLRCVERCLPDSTLQRNPGACALTVPKRMQTQPRRHVNRWSCFGHVPSRGKASRWRGRPSAIPACTRTVQVAKPLRLGSVQLQTPLVLAPMAGITSAPFRQLCARYGAELCVSELIIASTLLQRTPAALHLARWAKDESVRSAQLYASRPADMQHATAALVQDYGISHLDINFGCPVRKITSRGGGSAIPLKPMLFASLVRAAVAGACGVPVTVKMRLGVSPAMESFQEAGRIAQAEGAAAIVLHARYAEQLYAPPVSWQAITSLADALSVPVIGNGDVFTAEDGLAMLATGARGVMIGRACLGRPWVFAEVAAAMRGEPAPPRATLGQAVSDMHEHMRGLAEWEGSERSAALQMRKFVPLYLHGFASAKDLQYALVRCEDLAGWDLALQACPYDVHERAAEESDRLARLKGGKHGATKRIVLPDRWLEAGYDVDSITDMACEG